MACCNAEIGTKPKRGRAVISCFVKHVKHEETVYAVVCRHVTQRAEGSFFVEGIETSIAEKMKKKTTKPRSKKFNNNDIDIIEVKNDIVCKSVFRKGNDQKNARIFKGNIEDLFGKTVFQCYKTEPNGEYIVKLGKVLSLPDISSVLKDSYHMSTHFVVGGDTFADAGDSGRIVAFEADDGFLELLGIIVSDDAKTKCTVCYLLCDGLQYLNRQYGLELTLYESQQLTSGDETGVLPGQTMTFNFDR